MLIQHRKNVMTPHEWKISWAILIVTNFQFYRKLIFCCNHLVYRYFFYKTLTIVKYTFVLIQHREKCNDISSGNFDQYKLTVLYKTKLLLQTLDLSLFTHGISTIKLFTMVIFKFVSFQHWIKSNSICQLENYRRQFWSQQSFSFIEN